MHKHRIFLIFFALALAFIVFFGITAFRYYQAIHSDDPIIPYLSVELGTATITRGNTAIDLDTSESYDLREGDIVITRTASLATIAWPDHSITRLGAGSRVTIERMRVADDYSYIELVAVLESGKIWSNIVRTLYPKSRVEFRVPKTGTVVGVRGTVFEINMDENYIHSVEHNVMLQGKMGQSPVTLMPGEAVQLDNITKKILVGLDTAWASMNELKDATYIAVRDSELRGVYRLLIGTSDIPDIWDRFVRWTLSWFAPFHDIQVMTAMSVAQVSDMTDVSRQKILKWYQVFQSKDFVQERDMLRGAIVSMSGQLANSDQIIDTLTRGALWDMQDASGSLLKNSQILLDDYSKKVGTTLDTLLLGIKKFDPKNLTIDPSVITTEGRALYERLFQ